MNPIEFSAAVDIPEWEREDIDIMDMDVDRTINWAMFFPRLLASVPYIVQIFHCRWSN